MRSRNLLPIFFAMAVFACREKPEDWLKKAKLALDRENSDLALQFFQKAYEVSLDDDFLVDKRNQRYIMQVLSADQNWLLLVGQSRKEDSGKPTGYFLRVIDLEDQDGEEAPLPFKPDHISISPAGKFSYFSAKTEAGKCEVLAWETDSEKFFKPPLDLTCENHPAVSDSGMILYMKDGKIGAYYLKEGRDEFPTMSRFPDKPVGILPAWAYFYFDEHNIPFLSYGSAGTYKLYNLDGKKILLLSKAGSYHRLFFIRGENNPGMITGGAGSRTLIFFHPTDASKQVKSFPIHNWLEAAFVKMDHYFYMNGESLISFRNGKTVALPFWASQIQADTRGNLYFLSPLGTAMVFHGRLPEPASIAIFKKGWDLHESN